MFAIDSSKGKIKVPASLVVRVAERLWRQPQPQRDQKLDRAEKRLKGKHPSMRDAAIVALADH
jgi:hypothetical protein